MLSVPPSAPITDDRVAQKKSYLVVNIHVRVESWVHPLGRARQLLDESATDTTSLRFRATSRGCYD